MTINFHDQDFNKPMLDKFLEAINSPDEHISIYMKSDGGSSYIMEAMLHIIAQNPERFNLVGYDELSSSGFEFYIRAKCRKELISGTIGMHHQSTRDICTNDKGKPAYYHDEAALKRKQTIFWEELMNFMANCEFTTKEIKKIKKGDDVYFQYNRFKEIEQAYFKNTTNESSR